MSNSLPSGCMYLYDRAIPGFKQGDYELKLMQALPKLTHEEAMADTVLTTGESTLIDAGQGLLKTKRHFTVTGPRFTLTPDDVNSVYPPPYEPDAQTWRLPMVVLKRYTLPWEVDLFNGVDDTKLKSYECNGGVPSAEIAEKWPSMALLLFEDSELNPETDIIRSVRLDDVIDSSRLNVMGVDDQSMVVNCIDVKSSVLRQVVPPLDELKQLAHVRQVDTDDAELCGDDEDGWLAVIYSNRLIVSSLTKYTACLVSLEGRVDEPFMPQKIGWVQNPGPLMSVDEYVEEYPAGDIAEDHRTKLVLLHHWTFTSGESGDFQSTMEPGALDVGLFGKGMPYTEFKFNGHIPMELLDRVGNKRTVLYRGPLTPTNVEYKEKDHPYNNSDEALAIDLVTGHEEYSHGAAFELGRLLAMSNTSLMEDLALWRKSLFMVEVGHQQADLFSNHLGLLPNRIQLKALLLQELSEKMAEIQKMIATKEVIGNILGEQWPPGYYDPSPEFNDVRADTGIGNVAEKSGTMFENIGSTLNKTRSAAEFIRNEASDLSELDIGMHLEKGYDDAVTDVHNDDEGG